MKALLQERGSFPQLFPGPEEGRRVEINPPPFYWLRVPGVKQFTIYLEKVDGSFRTEYRTSDNHWVPDAPLDLGQYRWDLEGDGKRRGWWTFGLEASASIQVIPTSAAILDRLPAGHPRHYLRPEDAAAVRQHHRRHLPALRRNIRMALDDALPPAPDIHLPPDDVSRTLRYREWTNIARRYVDRNLVACVLGHHLFKQEECTALARRLLLSICTWNPDGPCSTDGAWGDEIGLSLLRCLPFCIDGLAGVLSADELAFATSTLAAHARAAHGRMLRTDFSNTPGISHVGRLAGYLGEAAVVLDGHVDRAESQVWLDYALSVYATFFPFFGGVDGGWAEGPFYASSYTRWYLPFFLLLERNTGFTFLERPFYRRLAGFFLHFARRDWEVHPFGDGWWCHSDDAEWPGFFAQDPFRIYAERFGSGTLARYRRKMEPPAHLELHLLDLFVPPALLRHSKNSVEGRDCEDAVFPDAGFASMQCDLIDERKNTALLARASKFGNGSHQHADQGSFAIMRRGRGLIIPSGTFGARWGSEHHLEWTTQTRAHNCLLIGGKGQRPGHLGAARFLDMRVGTAGGSAYSHVVADLSQAYDGVVRYHRHFFFFKPDLIVIADDLLLHEAQSVTACLHSSRKPFIGTDVVTLRARSTIMETAFLAGGKLLLPRVLARYPVPVNQGIPRRFAVKRPELFHWRWELDRSKRHFLVTLCSLDRKLPLLSAEGAMIHIGKSMRLEDSGSGIALHG